jgi:hypothetical protein
MWILGVTEARVSSELSRVLPIPLSSIPLTPVKDAGHHTFQFTEQSDWKLKNEMCNTISVITHSDISMTRNSVVLPPACRKRSPTPSRFSEHFGMGIQGSQVGTTFTSGVGLANS